MVHLHQMTRRVVNALVLPAAIALGVAGFSPATTEALAKTDIGCLALNIYHEARGESQQGQLAVAAVTLNRVRDDRFPDSVCAVVWQPHQFSWTHTQRSYFPSDMKAWKAAMRIAESSLSKKVVAEYDNLLYYHSKRVRPYWSKKKRFVARVGSHLFYSS
ncbi:MAG: cell wall hydrolase [Proteobacteria bacterium]|nr:MAG: cell wall hydrolase [Pseudomonadota bacterium]